MADLQALLFAADPQRPWRVQRTRRSLHAAGFTRIVEDLPSLHDGPCLLIRAGEVLGDPAGFHPPPQSTIPLVAAGLAALPPHPWLSFHERHGGSYPAELPPPLCEWHSDPDSLARRLAGQPLPPGPRRRVHWAPLDLAPSDDRLSMLQVVTSLQHGGAERIARDLALQLPHEGLRCRLVVLGKPFRQALEAPPGTVDLSALPREARLAALIDFALRSGVDLLHLHLLHAADVLALTRSGIPTMVSIHNARPGWPRDWDQLPAAGPALLFACAQAVEDQLRESLPGLPVRTVWNGVALGSLPERPTPSVEGGFTLACIANPRPQKRLDRLPAILVATRKALAARGVKEPQVRLLLAGETSRQLAEAVNSREAVLREAARWGVTEQLHWTEGRAPVPAVLARSHSLISCSAYEGLSLAHLEALACGVPVVACEAGGTRELGRHQPGLRLLPADADPTAIGGALAETLLNPPAVNRQALLRDFTVEVMARRVACLARQVARRPSASATTLWFVTNHLGTGGAQSSLRRLAKALHARGHAVQVALLQEYPGHPTAGRQDLLAASIPVRVPLPAGLLTPEQSVDEILAGMAEAPPQAVVFWNAIAPHKMLLADALPFTRIYDVSPGGMWHESFERAFQNPPPGLPCRGPGDYGRQLAGIVVKHRAEAAQITPFGATVHVIPNGVPLPERGLRRPTTSGPLVFATAARISPQKRLDELLEAFRLALPGLPPCILRIAGGIEHGAESHARDLRQTAHDLPVEWLGECHDLAALHAACDVFVMISDPPGCPNASLEALAAGLPVIATDVGGAHEQVIDGRTGRLIPARDVPALAQAMGELARNPALRETLGDAGREHIRRHFSLERMVADYELLLGGRS